MYPAFRTFDCGSPDRFALRRPLGNTVILQHVEQGCVVAGDAIDAL